MSDFEYRAAVEREILQAAPIAVMRAEFANGAVDHARAAAPVWSGVFRGSLAASVGRADSAGIIGRLSSDDPFAHLKEFGSVNNPPFATMRRAVESTGLRVTDRAR